MTRKNKIWISLIVCVAAVAAGIWGTSIVASASPLNRAKTTAAQYVPEGAELISAEEESRTYEIEYFVAATDETYEIVISKSTGEIKKLESDRKGKDGSKQVKLTQEQAEAALQKEIPGAVVQECRLQADDDQLHYYLVFETDQMYGTVEIDPQTGEILERDYKYGAPVTIPTSAQDPATAQKDSYLKEAAVRDILEKKVAGGTVTQLELEEEKGSYLYQATVQKDSVRHDIVIDAVTGEVLSNRQTEIRTDAAQREDLLTYDEARAIVEEKLPGCKLQELKLEYGDGCWRYEGEAVQDGAKCEFKLNAVSGEVLQWHHRGDHAKGNGHTGTKAPQATAKPNTGNSATYIGEAAARKVVTNKVSDATITKVELEKDDGRMVYEIDAYKGNTEYDVKVDAYTGAILEWEEDKENKGHTEQNKTHKENKAPAASKKPAATKAPSEPSVIGTEKAKQIVLGRVPGATIRELELDRDDGRTVYEGEAREGNVEYEFKIDAYTGSVLKWEKDIDD